MLGRAHRVAPLLESLAAATPEPHRVLFLCSPADDEVHAAIHAAGAEYLIVGWGPGRADYQRKVHAGIAATSEPLIFLGASDLHFHPGWLAAALAHLAPGIGVIGTNDLGNPRVMRGETSTHSLVTREYAELGTVDGQPGLFHLGYDHNFCDTEMVDTARSRGAWAFAEDSHVEHFHPSWSKAPEDDTYRRGRARFAVDGNLYRRRRRLWT